MDAMEEYVMKMAIALKQTVVVIVRHECEGEEHDGFKINCDVYQHLMRDARDVENSKGSLSK